MILLNLKNAKSAYEVTHRLCMGLAGADLFLCLLLPRVMCSYEAQVRRTALEQRTINAFYLELSTCTGHLCPDEGAVCQKRPLCSLQA